MPIYEYRCANGHRFEVFQSMSEESLTTCIECAATAERVLSAPAVHFKGSGFYATDYARKGAKAGATSDSGPDSSSSEKGSSEKSSSKGSSSEKPKSSSKSDS